MLALIVFFLSGFAALLYQVIWQRLLVFFSGADVYSVTLIVAAFMGGLGAGSLAGGHLADRLGGRRSLAAFAAVELLVGFFGLASKPIFYDTLYVGYAHLASSPAVAAVVLFFTLLVPTFLMGLSFPLLARATAASLEHAPRMIGSLYGWNTLGAALGALTATWLLIPRIGLERSLWVAAIVNFACASAALYRAMQQTRASDPTPSDTPPPAPLDDTTPFPFGMWVTIYALTGFVALGLEIAWFRVLGVLLKSTAFTFGTLLAVYLAGLGAGAAIGSRRAARSPHAGATFLSLQYAVTIYTALSTALLVTLIAAGHPIKLVRFLGSYDPVDIYATFEKILAAWPARAAVTELTDFAVLYLVVPVVLIGPPTVLMGMSFPFMQRATQVDFPRVGRRLGTLLAANVAGGVLGAMLVGWALLPWIGTAGTLRLLVASGAALAWPYARLRWRQNAGARRRAIGMAAAATLAALLVMPDGDVLWSRLHGTAASRILFDEDGAGLSLIKLDPRNTGAASEVYVNGLGQSWIPYGNIHTALGALPAFIHPAPADVALIGLGSGDTAFGAAGRPEIQRLVSIEILGAQRRTLERLSLGSRYAGLGMVLSDPRIAHVTGDGRAYLVHTAERFDVVEADALRPSSAYAGNLYSREYFTLLRERLKPGGLAVTWAPTPRIQATFLDVFPHVLAFRDGVYVGSLTPIAFDPAAILVRVEAARDYYHAAGVDIVRLLQPYLDPLPRRYGPDAPRAATPLNTDMFPRDEFALPF